MENMYCIGVANRYAPFLEQEEDILDILKLEEQEKEAKKKATLLGKLSKNQSENKRKPTQTPNKEVRDAEIPKTLDSVKSKENNKSVSLQTPERSERVESCERKGQVENGSFLCFGDDWDRSRAAARSKGRFRGSKTALASGFKRDFDRQSGSDKTGVKSVSKREGGGSHNWGNHRYDIADQLHLPVDQLEWSVEQPPMLESDGEKEGDKNANEEIENIQPAEEEPKEMTLDEYYAMRGSRQKPTYNLRQAGEGEDMSQWKKMYILKKRTEDKEEADEGYDVLQYPQRVGRQKYLLGIDVHFADSKRGMRGRGRPGPRRFGRWCPPRRSDEDGVRSASYAFGDSNEHFDSDEFLPRVDDEHIFPSLG